MDQASKRLDKKLTKNLIKMMSTFQKLSDIIPKSKKILLNSKKSKPHFARWERRYQVGDAAAAACPSRIGNLTTARTPNEKQKPAW